MRVCVCVCLVNRASVHKEFAISDDVSIRSMLHQFVVVPSGAVGVIRHMNIRHLCCCLCSTRRCVQQSGKGSMSDSFSLLESWFLRMFLTRNVFCQKSCHDLVPFVRSV